ncbi:thioredoxin family protein [Paenibacillus sp. JCM 10914]|uniref:thioredoxin family protein n=1 Tax=Paenibacillus sp. JCM 10914 TaxID=1236974 RepID=UPI0003CCAC9D|nr:thioredoxin family protein [Paenibacillus sp. JCM 10914]GAE09972.1 thioredoxin [Paenibacillus sp. JCM 10914]
MTMNMANHIGTGRLPQQFVDGMQKNQDTFKRGYEQFTWDNEEDKAFFESLNDRDNLRVLILAADWCGDVARNVPVVFRAMETAGIQTEVLIMEENLDVMDQFLTLGGRSIPVVIFSDIEGNVQGTWGPRPAHVQKYMIEFKKDNPNREAPDYQDNMAVTRQNIVQAYGEGNAAHAVIIQELRELISGF